MYLMCHCWSKTTTRKRQVDNKALPKPERQLEFEARDNKEYEIKAIIDGAVYSHKANNN